MRQHRRVAPGHHRPDLAAHRREEDLAGAFGGVVGIDMRIGAIAGHHRRVVDDRVIEVGVHVERHRDRRRRVDRADPAQQLPLAVLEAFRDHRAVQIEHDAVIAALAHRLADCPGHLLIGGVLDRAARRRPGGDRQHHLGPFPLGEIEIGAEPRPGAAIGPDRRLAIADPAPYQNNWARTAPAASAPARRCWSRASSWRSASACERSSRRSPDDSALRFPAQR